MRTARIALALVGIGLVGVGGWEFLSSDVDNAGGVIVHDGLLAPAIVALGVVAARALPTWLRGPATVGLVVLGTVTLLAVPVLGRFGARPDNPPQLDRNYGVGWLVFAAVVLLGVGAWAAVRRRRMMRESR